MPSWVFFARNGGLDLETVSPTAANQPKSVYNVVVEEGLIRPDDDFFLAARIPIQFSYVVGID